MMRHVLAEEDVPAVVERDHRSGGWTVLVAEAAVEDLVYPPWQLKMTGTAEPWPFNRRTIWS